MGEAAAEGVMHRRIEFHAATRPHAATAAAAAGGAGGFRVERLNPDADKRVVVAAARGEGQGKRLEKGEASGSGFDRELSAASIYLRRIGAGLHNLGNTCYLNSVLQCLTYTEPFVDYLQSGKHKSSCRTAGFCALCALQKHVRCALQSTGKILTPMQFVKNLRCISRSFRLSRQEDAHELMVNLLESMHKCCLPSGVPSESPSAYEKSLVHRIFGGRLRSQVRCTRCSHCSNKSDPFLDLSLEIAKASTLVKALQNFTEEELLDGGEKQYNCQRCRKKVVAKKRFTIDKAPDVLTIHLKRFSPFNPYQKIDKKVDFQPTLNLKPFVSNSEGMDFRYSLYGVLVHAGWNTQSGHYYCFVRTSSGIWHNLDDNQVHQVREADVLRQKAYMLFYVRDRVRSSVMHKDNGAANLSGKKLISEKITCMNGAIRNGLVETALNVSSFVNGDVKLQKRISDNGQSSIISNTSQYQCSTNHSNTKVIEGAASQNNSTDSVQKAPCVHPDTAATLSTKTNETTSDSQKEKTSPAEPDVITLHDQKAFEKPLQEQQLEPDGAFTDSGKDTPAAFPTCNGADGLLGTNGQASEPRTDPFCKPTLGISNTAAIVQIIPTKDTAVINATISSIENLTSSNEAKESAEPVKQHDEMVTVKELSAKDTDDIAYTEEQTSVQNNTLDAGQSTVKELSAKDTDRIANAEEQASVHNIALEVGQVNSEKQICSQDSAQVVCSEDSAQVICSKDSAQVLYKDPCHGKMDFKSKYVKYPVVNLFLGSKLLLLAALKLRKKRKHKRTKRRSTFLMDIECIANDQQTSTSETVRTKDIPCKSHRRKRSRASAGSDNGDQMLNKEQHLAGDSTSAADLPMDKKDNKDPTLASELPSSCPNSVANQIYSRKCAHANERASRHFNILTRGLREITVPRWDDIDMPNTEATEFQYPRTNSIGYVLDEWDEEYDRGRRRKVRKSKEDLSGPNPFQEAADIRSRQWKRLKADQARSGNQPRSRRIYDI